MMEWKNRYISTIRKKTGNKRVIGYRVQIRYFDNGAPKKYTKYFSVKNPDYKDAVLYSAREHRDKMISNFSEIGFEISNLPEKTTVEDMFYRVPKYYKRTKKTYDNFTARYNKYIGQKYGKKDIFLIREKDIEDSLCECADVCVQSSVQQVAQIWNMIFQIAIRQGINVSNPVPGLDVPQSHNVTERSYAFWNITEEEFQDFCEYFANYGRYRDWDEKRKYNRQIILYLLLFLRVTGLRPQEAKALERKDFIKDRVTFRNQKTGEKITTDRIRVIVNKSVGSTQKEDITIKETKTKQSVRAVPILREEERALVEEIFVFSKYDRVFSDYYGNLVDSK